MTSKYELSSWIFDQLHEYKEDGHRATSVLTTHFHVRRPYICVVVSYHGVKGRAVGVGFSRTEGPWDVEEEYRIALARAARDIETQLS